MAHQLATKSSSNKSWFLYAVKFPSPACCGLNILDDNISLWKKKDQKEYASQTIKLYWRHKLLTEACTKSAISFLKEFHISQSGPHPSWIAAGKTTHAVKLELNWQQTHTHCSHSVPDTIKTTRSILPSIQESRGNLCTFHLSTQQHTQQQHPATVAKYDVLNLCL